MDFKFIMDETLPEEVRIIAHQRTSLVDQIENLVLQYKGADRIAGYTEEELRMLSFDEIECITVLEGNLARAPQINSIQNGPASDAGCRALLRSIISRIPWSGSRGGIRPFYDLQNYFAYSMERVSRITFTRI